MQYLCTPIPQVSCPLFCVCPDAVTLWWAPEQKSGAQGTQMTGLCAVEHQEFLLRKGLSPESPRCPLLQVQDSDLSFSKVLGT